MSAQGCLARLQYLLWTLPLRQQPLQRCSLPSRIAQAPFAYLISVRLGVLACL